MGILLITQGPQHEQSAGFTVAVPAGRGGVAQSNLTMKGSLRSRRRARRANVALTLKPLYVNMSVTRDLRGFVGIWHVRLCLEYNEEESPGAEVTAKRGK